MPDEAMHRTRPYGRYGYRLEKGYL
jgi:hypothetical protein